MAIGILLSGVTGGSGRAADDGESVSRATVKLAAIMTPAPAKYAPTVVPKLTAIPLAPDWEGSRAVAQIRIVDRHVVAQSITVANRAGGVANQTPVNRLRDPMQNLLAETSNPLRRDGAARGGMAALRGANSIASSRESSVGGRIVLDVVDWLVPDGLMQVPVDARSRLVSFATDQWQAAQTLCDDAMTRTRCVMSAMRQDSPQPRVAASLASYRQPSFATKGLTKTSASRSANRAAGMTMARATRWLFDAIESLPATLAAVSDDLARWVTSDLVQRVGCWIGRFDGGFYPKSPINPWASHECFLAD